MKSVDPNFLSKTKKARRVQLANVPLHLGLSKADIKKLATDFIIEHYLNNPGNDNPIHTLDVNQAQRGIVLEMSCIEEANRLTKLDSFKILGVDCKIIRNSESLFGQEGSLVSKVQNAQVS